MAYVDEIDRLTNLIIDRFDIGIVMCKGDRSDGFARGSSHYSPKFLDLPPVITLNVRQSRYVVLSILAHELGHHFDTDNERWYWRAMFWNGVRFKNSKHRLLAKLARFLLKKSEAFILEREAAAWKLGFQFLKDNNFHIDHGMETMQVDGLSWYRDCST